MTNLFFIPEYNVKNYTTQSKNNILKEDTYLLKIVLG
jgi:hypothetical protein